MAIKFFVFLEEDDEHFTFGLVSEEDTEKEVMAGLARDGHDQGSLLLDSFEPEDEKLRKSHSWMAIDAFAKNPQGSHVLHCLLDKFFLLGIDFGLKKGRREGKG